MNGFDLAARYFGISLVTVLVSVVFVVSAAIAVLMYRPALTGYIKPL